MATNKPHETISNKISSLKTTYPSLRSKADSYVFSALCIKSNLFKNPALILQENDLADMIVDGKYDGGVDILLTDPNSENSDLIIAQSKLQIEISYEEVINAMTKMAMFYKDMEQGHFEQVNETVHRRYITLNSELAEESKIHFIFYTSALQSGINKKRIEKKFREHFSDSSKFDISIYFGADIEEEIKESESRRPTVEYGKIHIDRKGNYLEYNEEAAVIVNVSAFSIKELYAQHNINLLSRNLRYHIAGKDIDNGIKRTIEISPETFWLKNNGITIICDDFIIDGKEVKLYNFSIVNGGQTTYMIYKSDKIDLSNDLFLPCKIIKNDGENEDEKNKFSLEIAQATNTQKPIKPVDLKSNAPEQVRFAQTMREIGIFYQTKRGEKVPPTYKESYLNTSLLEIGKLCLAGIFQAPCLSRTKPSSLYQPKYYDKIFSGDHSSTVKIAKLCKQLLYIDYYFRNAFQKKYDKICADMPDESERISFSHNARTICIAFVAFASRYYQKNITNQNLQALSNSLRSDNNYELSEMFSNIDDITYFIPPSIFEQKDDCDLFLDELFTAIIDSGISQFTTALQYDPSLTATNFLKKDKNYYRILNTQWSGLKAKIESIFNSVK